MQEIINEKVSVLTLYNKNKGLNMPVKFRWHEKIYKINKLGFYHKYKKGRTIIHVFSVSNDSMAFRLEFDSENLSWILAEVSDGNAS